MSDEAVARRGERADGWGRDDQARVFPDGEGRVWWRIRDGGRISSMIETESFRNEVELRVRQRECYVRNLRVFVLVLCNKMREIGGLTTDNAESVLLRGWSYPLQYFDQSATVNGTCCRFRFRLIQGILRI